ncbi:MAG: hypothetical protein ACK4YP_22235, partial [Myxococcota bacterium]
DPWAGPPPEGAVGDADEVAPSAWMDEGVVHVGGLSARPLTGGGVAKRLGEGTWLGFRFLLPVWGPGPYATDLFVRRFFTPDRPASIYAEADASFWFQPGWAAPSGNVALGVRVRVHERIAVGGSLGPTLFPAAANPDTAWFKLGPLGAAPRMFAAVDFLLL